MAHAISKATLARKDALASILSTGEGEMEMYGIVGEDDSRSVLATLELNYCFGLAALEGFVASIREAA